MFSTEFTKRITVAVSAAAAGLAVSTTLFAAVAAAEPIGPDGPAHRDGQCAIVHHDDAGNEWVEYVPKGSRNGQLGYCGADGEWHAGLLIDERSPEPTGGGKKLPVVGGAGPVVVKNRA